MVPYGDGHYYDFRPSVGIAPEDVLRLNDDVGLNPNMGPVKRLWDEGNLAIIQGSRDMPSPNRSHFRSMDIWHTAESERDRRHGLARSVHQRTRSGSQKRADRCQLRARTPKGAVR